MKYCFKIFLILSAFLSINAMAIELNEQSVEGFIKKVDASFAEKDIESLASTISDQATLAGSMTFEGKTSEFSINKEQYISSVESGWNSDASYSYTKESTEIVLISQEEATIREIVVETATMGGNKYLIRSENQVVIKVVNDSLQAIKIIVKSKATKM